MADEPLVKLPPSSLAAQTLSDGDLVASSDMSKLKELEAKLDIYKVTLTEIYEQYDQKLEELSLVRRMGDALRATKELEPLAQALLETVALEVAVDRLVLMLAPEKNPEELFIRAAYWADQEIFSFFEPTQAVPWGLGVLGDLIPSGALSAPLIIESAAPEYDPLGRVGDGGRALLFLPLRLRHRLLGLLVLSRPDTRPFTPEDERILAIMSDQASAALSSVLLFDDLTRVNKRLRESESRARQVSGYLQRLLDTANDAIFTLNNQGIITYANRKAGQWGWQGEELLGKEFRNFLAIDDSLVGWEPGAPPPPDEVFAAVFIDAAGGRRDVLLSTSQVTQSEELTLEGRKSAGGELGPEYASWMLLATDVTERKYLEKQLIHSEKLASIGLLAAGVAHEVGNPLSAISGYAQLLEADDQSPEERREYLEAIVNQTGRIQKILRELLDYSRPSKGMQELLDLAEALPKTMSMIQAQRVFQNIEVSFDLDEKAAPHLVNMDRDHLAQMVIIIAMNAAHAMKGEGTFHLALAKEPPFWVSISFTDSGPGIPEQLLGHLFDPFFTTKNPGEGTGLGLSICQRLADSYHGRVEVKSRPGQGATFRIILPEANSENFLEASE